MAAIAATGTTAAQRAGTTSATDFVVPGPSNYAFAIVSYGDKLPPNLFITIINIIENTIL
jgi:hypothetical protein